MSKYLDRFEDGDRVEDRRKEDGDKSFMGREWVRHNGKWYYVSRANVTEPTGEWVDDDYMFMAIGKGYIQRVADE